MTSQSNKHGKKRNNEGQAFLEFVLTSGLLISVAVGAAQICRAEWQRTQCARLAFEAAHQVRIGFGLSTFALASSSARVSVQPISGGFRGIAQCGAIRETAELPTLESGQW